MIKITSYLVVAMVFLGIGYLMANRNQPVEQTSEEIKEQFIRTLDKYTIEQLAKVDIKHSEIVLDRILEENKEFTSYLFSFQFDPTLENKTLKKVTGVVNIPTLKPGQKASQDNVTFPLIFMLRGYVDQAIYQSGDGTQPSAKEFAKAGFITIAPDFLGYAESDTNALDTLESRFQSYTTALSIFRNLNTISAWDKRNLFVWGHSNGGQIALTLLEITNTTAPTVLWAPVSKPFPYSILAYTDEAEDRGKFLRQEISNFEKNYNPDSYSFDLYLDRISAPIQLHQGSLDTEVPYWWSNTLHRNLLQHEIEVEYFVYPGSDHNLRPSWNIVVERNIEFFKKHLTND